jgi:hypothetical protein
MRTCTCTQIRRCACFIDGKHAIACNHCTLQPCGELRCMRIRARIHSFIVRAPFDRRAVAMPLSHSYTDIYTYTYTYTYTYIRTITLFLSSDPTHFRRRCTRARACAPLYRCDSAVIDEKCTLAVCVYICVCARDANQTIARMSCARMRARARAFACVRACRWTKHHKCSSWRLPVLAPRSAIAAMLAAAVSLCLL